MNCMHTLLIESLSISSKVSDEVHHSPFDPDFIWAHSWLAPMNDMMWKAMLVVGGRNKVGTIINEKIKKDKRVK